MEKRIKDQNELSELKWVEQVIRQMERESVEEFDKKKEQLVADKVSELGA